MKRSFPYEYKRDRKTKLKNRYGITIDEYDEMFKEQEGVCAICKMPEVKKLFGNVVRLAVDHDHKTGKVRGLLCYKCNSILGRFNDNILLFESVIRYLKKGRD